MTRPIACILGRGDWTETNRAVASALGFGLDVAVGDSGQCALGSPHPGARCHAIEWRDDFADARNQLAGAVARGGLAGDYFLWIDSDEELIEFPGDAPAFSGPCLGTMIIDREGMRPRPILRLQRRDPLDAWYQAIHEVLPVGGAELPIVRSILLRHDGYDDPAVMAAKRERNRRIVERETAAGRDYYALALERARLAEDGAAFMQWLRAFNHPQAGPGRDGAYDPRVESAEVLCTFGYTAPALALLDGNPAIVPLQLAVLEATRGAKGAVDETRLAHVVELLSSTGRGDARYAYPAALEEATSGELIAWVRSVAVGRDDLGETGS